MFRELPGEGMARHKGHVALYGAFFSFLLRAFYCQNTLALGAMLAVDIIIQTTRIRIFRRLKSWLGSWTDFVCCLHNFALIPVEQV